MYIYRLRQSTTAINPTSRSSPRRTFLLIPLALILIGGVLGRSANAAFPGNNGKIAFHSFRAGGLAIFTVNPGGSGIVQLTSGLANDSLPAWSADGSKIAFVSDRDGNDEIYLMNADGSGQTRLTNNASSDELPAWSPDGSKIVFMSDRDGNDEIYSMNADGSSQTRLTNNAAFDFSPAWSPDGTKIAFDSDRDGNREIYTIDSDGSNPVRLTSNAASDSDPNWSPNGTALVFVSNRNGNFEIDSMNADGSNVTNLTRNTAFDADPAWSPDGSMITFTTNRNGLNEIAVMNADGSGQTVISTGPDGFPNWQPIGLTLVSSFSRKTGKFASFDVPLPGVEDRSDGKRFVIGFTFNNNVTGADSASTSCGTIGGVSVDPNDAHTLLVTFNGQTCNQQEVTVTLANVHDDQGNNLASAETTVGLLIGDVNGDGRVGNGDIGNIQGHLGEITDGTNFRDDMNADGRINNQDVQTARSHRGESLP